MTEPTTGAQQYESWAKGAEGNLPAIRAEQEWTDIVRTHHPLQMSLLIMETACRGLKAIIGGGVANMQNSQDHMHQYMLRYQPQVDLVDSHWQALLDKAAVKALGLTAATDIWTLDFDGTQQKLVGFTVEPGDEVRWNIIKPRLERLFKGIRSATTSLKDAHAQLLGQLDTLESSNMKARIAAVLAPQTNAAHEASSAISLSIKREESSSPRLHSAPSSITDKDSVFSSAAGVNSVLTELTDLTKMELSLTVSDMRPVATRVFRLVHSNTSRSTS